MSEKSSGSRRGGVSSPPDASSPLHLLRWLIGLRLIVISTLFLGVLIIQAGSARILPLTTFYSLFLLTYGLSLLYLVLYLRQAPFRLQVAVQLLGDVCIVTGFVYATGGLESFFSFLYLVVIVEASVFFPRWGYIYAGLSAVAYGVLIDLMFFGVIPTSPGISGTGASSNTSVLNQLLMHVVGFILLTFLVTRLIGSHLRLEERIERAKQYLALTDHVVRSVSSGIVATDLAGSILHLNPAAIQILGIGELERGIGHSFTELVPLRTTSWPLVLERAQVDKVQVTNRNEDSGTLLGLTIGPLVDDETRLVGFVINIEDLSEVERAAARQRMHERMAATGELAARMAHEIKNPLASIAGSAQMLASVGTLDDTGQRLLDIVVSESKRLSTILDGFLSYSQPQAPKLSQHDMVPLIEECCSLLRKSDEVESKHQIVLDTPSQLLVQGDENQLRQVIWNLSRNAIQAMPEGGELSISARLEGTAARLVWQDSGIGMPEDILKDAFEPFVTSHPHGTGLGLAVVYSVVRDHGGSVSIDSNPGRGTRVVVTLPSGEGAPA